MKITKKQIRLVRTAAAKAKLTDAEYDAVKMRFGVERTGDLEMEVLDDVLDHLEKVGFERSAPAYRETAAEILKKMNPADKKKDLLALTASLLAELGFPLAYADKMAKTIYQINKAT